MAAEFREVKDLYMAQLKRPEIVAGTKARDASIVVGVLEHARALQQARGEPAEIEVERRPLARYDRLIPA